MAETKKAVTVNTAAKAETVAKPEVKEVKPVVSLTAAPAVKTPEKKEEVKAEVKPETKAPAKKAAAKTPAKKAAAKKTPAKKAAAKTTAAKSTTAKKAAVKKIINFQFSGKSYSMEDLEKIADDVWKYDLHKNNETYESLELYVKPEESIAYYVFNGDVTGSFFI